MAEDPFIIRMNIAHYEAMLALPIEEKRRIAIGEMLAQAKLVLVDGHASEAASLRATVEELRNISQQCRAQVENLREPKLKRLVAEAALAIAQVAELLEIEIGRQG